MSRYAVIGNPIAHSKSPLIHSLFASQTGENVTYDAFVVEPAELNSFVLNFFENGGAGLNVTLPFKENVYAMVKASSDRAALAKAVNTLFLDDSGQLCGDNTDGVGLVRDIQQNHQFQIRGKRVLILGAGGAVRGALGSLLAEQPAHVCIANRTRTKAAQLQREMENLGSIEAVQLDNIQDATFDLIINGTSMGIKDEVPPINSSLLASNCCCYDMMYGRGDTAFVSWAKSNGAAVALDGLGMLVEQAAEAFAIWRGVRPQTDSVIARLRG